MPKVTVNGTEIEVDKGTTILRAAAEAGFEVPHFCYHPALSIPANCRMCLVEVEGAWKLQPACYSQVTDGMVINTKSERVVKAQKAVLEFILVNHPVDCPICDQAGECKLQDYYVAYDSQESRLRAEKVHKVKVFPIGPEVLYDGERCILCTRCVRFCEEITATNELTIVQRGDRAEIRAFPGRELDNKYSVCTADICPVGALTARDFRFKCRVWLLNSTDSVCTGCSNGCNIHLEHFRNEIQRYRPRFNPAVNDYWMCDAGRLTYKEVHTDRLLHPTNNGAELNWHAVCETVADKLKRAIDEVGSDKIALVLSPQASCEDLHLARKFASDVIKTSRFYMGGKRDGDSDDFLIKADKNPNRRGIEAVFGSTTAALPFSQLVDDIEAGTVQVVYMMDQYMPVDAATAARFVERLDKLKLFVFQAQHQGALAQKAHIALPVCSHAESEGTFVNFEGIAQGFERAFAAHGESLPHWQIFMRLAQAMGKPFSYTFIQQIRKEMFAPRPDSVASGTAEGVPVE
ncbi:MAG: molybdopterin-dependent oxidoreductase [Bradymonadaceae bacterium]|nr:molybdopterin-dependent oxidoreductase [Lujinxingiaceae bacterium]